MTDNMTSPLFAHHFNLNLELRPAFSSSSSRANRTTLVRVWVYCAGVLLGVIVLYWSADLIILGAACVAGWQYQLQSSDDCSEIVTEQDSLYLGASRRDTFPEIAEDPDESEIWSIYTASQQHLADNDYAESEAETATIYEDFSSVYEWPVWNEQEDECSLIDFPTSSTPGIDKPAAKIPEFAHLDFIPPSSSLPAPFELAPQTYLHDPPPPYSLPMSPSGHSQRALAMSSLYTSLATHLNIPFSELPSPPTSVSPVSSEYSIIRPSAPAPPPPIPRRSSRRLTLEVDMHYTPIRPRLLSVASVEDLGLAREGAPVLPTYIRPGPSPLGTSDRDRSRSSSFASSTHSLRSCSSSISSVPSLTSSRTSSLSSTTSSSINGSSAPATPSICTASMPSTPRTSLSSASDPRTSASYGPLTPTSSIPAFSRGTPSTPRLRRTPSPQKKGRSGDLRLLRIRDSELCLQHAYDAQTRAYLAGDLGGSRRGREIF